MDEPESYKFCKLSLSLESSFFLPSCKYDMSPFEEEVVCTDFIGKMISHRRESNAIRSPLIMKHMYSLHPLLQDWQLQVSGGMGFGVLVNRLLYKHAPLFTGAIHKKNAVPNPISHGPYS